MKNGYHVYVNFNQFMNDVLKVFPCFNTDFVNKISENFIIQIDDGNFITWCQRKPDCSTCRCDCPLSTTKTKTKRSIYYHDRERKLRRILNEGN